MLIDCGREEKMEGKPWREKVWEKTQNRNQDMKTQPAAAVDSFQLFYIFVILVPGDK